MSKNINVVDLIKVISNVKFPIKGFPPPFLNIMCNLIHLTKVKKKERKYFRFDSDTTTNTTFWDTVSGFC